MLVTINKTSGFTLTELMVTISIAGIMLAVAVPSLHSFILDNRLASQSTEFTGALAMARSEASRRSSRMVVSPAASGFDGGWKIWADTNGNTLLDAGEAVLRIHEDLHGNTLTSSGAVSPIVYLPSGFMDMTAGASRIFQLCDKRSGEKGREIRIAATGRVSINRDFICP